LFFQLKAWSRLYLALFFPTRGQIKQMPRDKISAVDYKNIVNVKNEIEEI